MRARVFLNLKTARIIWICLILSSSAGLCEQGYQPLEKSTLLVYTVKPGDTVSQILFALNIGPLYGRHGAIVKITRLNDRRLQKNGDFIRPGSLIYLRTTPFPNGLTPVAQEIFVAPPPTLTPPAAPSPPPPPPTPTPQAAPPQAIQATALEEDLFSEIALGASADYFVLQGYQPSNRTSARLLSGLTPALSADWKHWWSARTFTHLFLDWSQASIKPGEAGFTLSGSSFSRTALGFGVGTFLGSKTLLQFDASMAQELFYHATGPMALQLDEVPLAHVRTRVETTVLERRPFRLTANAGASYIGSGSFAGYTIKSGFDYEFGLKVVQMLKGGSFGCGPEFVTRQQDTSIVDLRERSMGMYCLFTHDLRSAAP